MTRVPNVATVDATKSAFRGPEVCALAGVTYRQLDYWARTGLVTPSICEARGSGSQRLYSVADLAVVRMIRSLIDEDNSTNSRLQLVRRIAPIARDLVEQGLDVVLAVTAGDVIVVENAEQLLALARKHHAIHILTGFGPEASVSASSTAQSGADSAAPGRDLHPEQTRRDRAGSTPASAAAPDGGAGLLVPSRDT